MLNTGPNLNQHSHTRTESHGYEHMSGCDYAETVQHTVPVNVFVQFQPQDHEFCLVSQKAESLLLGKKEK